MEPTAYRYMEDFKTGDTFRAGPIVVTAEEIIAFARQFDPQYFHTDPDAARDSVFGKLAASGWHTASITMRLIVESMPKMPGGLIGRGVESLNWPRPVYPGDSLSYEGEVVEVLPSKSRPDRGILRVAHTTRNQDGKIVLQMTSAVLAPRRPAG